MTEQVQYTREELSKRLYETQVAKCIISNQFSLELNERLTGAPFYKHKLKQLGQPYIRELIKCHKAEFIKVEDAAMTLEGFSIDVIDEAFEKSGKIISLLTKMAFVDYDLLERVLIATAYDSKSMDGMAVKTIKRKK